MRLERGPLAGEVSYVHNFGAPDQTRAVEALVEAGAGRWRFTYAFQRVEREAVVGAFTSDDWWYHSDFRGSRATATRRWGRYGFWRVAGVWQGSVQRVQVEAGAGF